MLTNPRNDPLAMAAIAKQMEFDVRGPLLDCKATWDVVKHAIRDAADELESGDFFFLTFAGHGKESRKTSGVQSWCLFDQEVSDIEVLIELRNFKPGVRVLVVSASCHSGGMNSGPPSALKELTRHLTQLMRALMEAVTGTPDACRITRPRSHKVPSEFKVPPSILFLASCEAKEKSQDQDLPNINRQDGTSLSLFTRVLTDTWNDGAFEGTYRDLISVVRREVSKANADQHPTCAFAGEFPAWHTERPFVIDLDAPEMGEAPELGYVGV